MTLNALRSWLLVAAVSYRIPSRTTNTPTIGQSHGSLRAQSASGGAPPLQLRLGSELLPTRPCRSGGSPPDRLREGSRRKGAIPWRGGVQDVALRSHSQDGCG